MATNTYRQAKERDLRSKRSHWILDAVSLCPGKEIHDEIAGEEEFTENSNQVKQIAWRALAEMDELQTILILKNHIKVGVFLAKMLPGKKVDLKLLATI